MDCCELFHVIQIINLTNELTLEKMLHYRSTIIIIPYYATCSDQKQHAASGRGDLLVGYHYFAQVSCLARVRELYTKPD